MFHKEDALQAQKVKKKLGKSYRNGLLARHAPRVSPLAGNELAALSRVTERNSPAIFPT
jgi:hypothetical protein